MPDNSGQSLPLEETLVSCCAVHTNEDPERLSRERNLFFRLLQVGLAEDAAPYAAEVLDLLVEVTGAQRGFLAVEGEAGAGRRP